LHKQDGSKAQRAAPCQPTNQTNQTRLTQDRNLPASSQLSIQHCLAQAATAQARHNQAAPETQHFDIHADTHKNTHKNTHRKKKKLHQRAQKRAQHTLQHMQQASFMQSAKCTDMPVPHTTATTLNLRQQFPCSQRQVESLFNKCTAKTNKPLLQATCNFSSLHRLILHHASSPASSAQPTSATQQYALPGSRQLAYSQH
jgi:hypothetical protein